MSLIGCFTSCRMGTRPLGCRWVSGVIAVKGGRIMRGVVCGLLLL